MSTMPDPTEQDARFSAVRRVYGDSGFDSLQSSHVCVAGIGGVGSWAVEALARSGVGTITLIDKDTISESNINRQVHSLSTTLGRLKTEVMKERVHEINPQCECHAIDDYLTDITLEKYLSNDLSYVVDAIDGVNSKAAIIYYCKRNKIPVITTGGAGGLTDPTAIEVRDLSRTWNDPLAAKVRSRLRHQYGYTRNPKRTFGIKCVYSIEQPRYPKEDGSVDYRKPGVAGLTLDCNFGYGSSNCVTAAFGMVAAGRVLDKLSEGGPE